jgi:hypothetical protein
VADFWPILGSGCGWSGSAYGRWVAAVRLLLENAAATTEHYVGVVHSGRKSIGVGRPSGGLQLAGDCFDQSLPQAVLHMCKHKLAGWDIRRAYCGAQVARMQRSPLPSAPHRGVLLLHLLRWATHSPGQAAVSHDARSGPDGHLSELLMVMSTVKGVSRKSAPLLLLFLNSILHGQLPSASASPLNL